MGHADSKVLPPSNLNARMTNVLVLDVGGVLVKLGGMNQFVDWTGQSPEEIKSRWLASPTVRDFESGRLAHTCPEPNASTRVLTKCGFRRVGEVMDPDDGLVWRWEKDDKSA